jgi:Ca2+-binding EF-hand superfamily protein
MNIKYQGMDRNNDGRVTRNEWRASSDRSFDNHDWNGDGILSDDEVKAWRDEDDDWNDQGRGWAWGRRGRFGGMDRNGDGRISRQEWRGHEEDFESIDSDDNGLLTVEEIREFRFREMDVNHDNRVTRAEWKGSARSFDTLDLNKNGVLKPSEFVSQRRVQMAVFSDLDVNGDKRISRGEWKGTVNDFNRLDVGGDGLINMHEFQTGQDNVETGSPAAASSGTQAMIEQLFEQFLSNQ